MNETISWLLARTLTTTLFLTSGYLVGYLHATSMPENAAPGFMLGFTVTATFVVAALVADRYDVTERLGVRLQEGGCS